MKKQKGVTLVELMTVVGVVSILAAVGYPMYLEQVVKGRRAGAKAMLHNVLQQSERFYTENNTFTDDMQVLGFGPGPYLSENDTHTISLAEGPTGDIATSVTISATPTAPDEKCNVLTLSSDLSHTASGTNQAICW
jgi:type IV pilus assembly protein PilE